MTPTRLTLTDYAGATRTIALAPLTLLAAPNGSGKTKALGALHLGMTARYPGADKPPTLDDARAKGGGAWRAEVAFDDGSVVAWSFSGSQFVPSVVIPGRMPPKGKDATIAAIQERFGAAVTLHLRDLERLDPEALARWVVSLCAGRVPSGSALTTEGCRTMLAPLGIALAPHPGEPVLHYLDTVAAALETSAAEARSEKRRAETDPARKAAPVAPAPGALALAEQEARDAAQRHEEAVGALATAKATAEADRRAWEERTAAQRAERARLTQEACAAQDDSARLTLDRDGIVLPALPADPGPAPAKPEGHDGLDAMTEAFHAAQDTAIRSQEAVRHLEAAVAGCEAGTCPTCGTAAGPSVQEALAEALAGAREKLAAAAREESTQMARRDALAGECRRYDVAARRWTEAANAHATAMERRNAAEARRADLDTRIAEHDRRRQEAEAVLAALDPVPEPPALDAGALVTDVEMTKAAATKARGAVEALRTQARAVDDALAKRASLDAAIEGERVRIEKLKAAAEQVAALRLQAVGQAVGPFVDAVNARLAGALGTLVVDLAPVARVGFARGEALVPVAELSGMEAARWLAAAAVVAAGLSGSPCQYVLVDDVDRLTATPRAALLGLLAEAVSMGDLGGCLCALAWEAPDLPVVPGWTVAGLGREPTPDPRARMYADAAARGARTGD